MSDTVQPIDTKLEPHYFGVRNRVIEVPFAILGKPYWDNEVFDFESINFFRDKVPVLFGSDPPKRLGLAEFSKVEDGKAYAKIMFNSDYTKMGINTLIGGTYLNPCYVVNESTYDKSTDITEVQDLTLYGIAVNILISDGDL